MGIYMMVNGLSFTAEQARSMRSVAFRLGMLPFTTAAYDFQSQIGTEDVPVSTVIPSLVPDQPTSVITVSGAFASAVTNKGLLMTSSTANEYAVLPDEFKLNWETDPSYMLSIWYTNIAPVSAVTYAPFIGWANNSSDKKWALGPWANAAKNTWFLEGSYVDLDTMADTSGTPQMVAAFVRRAGVGVCNINFYHNGVLKAVRTGVSYAADPTVTAGSPRIGKMPSLNGTYSGVVHSAQVAKIPSTSITDEAGWAAQEYADHLTRYTV